jgi:MoxR-like ATPase
VALTERDIPTLQVAERVRRVADQIETVIIGKRDVVEMALTAFLCGGHVLIEDIPGVGKTTLAKALARALGCVSNSHRIYFLPTSLGPASTIRKTPSSSSEKGRYLPILFSRTKLTEQLPALNPHFWSVWKSAK